MAPRGRSVAAALCLAALAACDPGKEIEEEFDALARDHDVVIVADLRIVVGGYGYGGVSDACGPADNEECEDDRLAIIDVMSSGGVTSLYTSGAQFGYVGATTPGGGTLTLTVQHEEHAEDPDGTPDPPIAAAVSIAVLPPEGAVVAPYCTVGALGVEAPYLVPTGGEAQVTWRFILDGRVEGGDDGTIPIDAPDLELITGGAPLATYQAPDTPGVARVSSTTYDSSFDFEVHDPAGAVMNMEVRGLNFGGDAIEVAAWTEVAGRPVCSEQGPRTFTSETPEVCLIRYAGETFATHDETAASADVVPIAAGDCRIRASVTDTALEEVVQFAVAPLQPEDMWWQNTCDAGDGTTCGLACEFGIVEASGCEWTWTDEFTCDEDPAEIRCSYVQHYVGLDCPETAQFPPYRVECWE